MPAAGGKFGGFHAGIHSKIAISKGFYTLNLDFFLGDPPFFHFFAHVQKIIEHINHGKMYVTPMFSAHFHRICEE